MKKYLKREKYDKMVTFLSLEHHWKVIKNHTNIGMITDWKLHLSNEAWSTYDFMQEYVKYLKV
jgi:hypothetical protein